MHLKWLQHKDIQIGQPGFLSVYMPMHVYVMRKEVGELQKNWKTFVQYEPYLDIVDGLQDNDDAQRLEKEAMGNFADAFFNIATERFEKSFLQWRTKILQLMLGADDMGAQALALYIEGKEIPAILYNSEKHNAKIDIKDMILYLTEKVVPTVQSCPDHHCILVFRSSTRYQ
jgi:hypothetical protein